MYRFVLGLGIGWVATCFHVIAQDSVTPILPQALIGFKIQPSTTAQKVGDISDTVTVTTVESGTFSNWVKLSVPGPTYLDGVVASDSRARNVISVAFQLNLNTLSGLITEDGNKQLFQTLTPTGNTNGLWGAGIQRTTVDETATDKITLYWQGTAQAPLAAELPTSGTLNILFRADDTGTTVLWQKEGEASTTSSNSINMKFGGQTLSDLVVNHELSTAINQMYVFNQALTNEQFTQLVSEMNALSADNGGTQEPAPPSTGDTTTAQPMLAQAIVGFESQPSSTESQTIGTIKNFISVSADTSGTFGNWVKLTSPGPTYLAGKAGTGNQRNVMSIALRLNLDTLSTLISDGNTQLFQTLTPTGNTNGLWGAGINRTTVDDVATDKIVFYWQGSARDPLAAELPASGMLSLLIKTDDSGSTVLWTQDDRTEIVSTNEKGLKFGNQTISGLVVNHELLSAIDQAYVYNQSLTNDQFTQLAQEMQAVQGARPTEPEPEQPVDPDPNPPVDPDEPIAPAPPVTPESPVIPKPSDQAILGNTNTLTALGSAQHDAMTRHMGQIRNRTLHLTRNSEMLPTPGPVYHFWVNALAAHNQLNNQDHAAGYDINSWGGSLGVDINVNHATALGMAFSADYGKLRSSVSNESASGHLNGYYLHLFARHQAERFAHLFVIGGALYQAQLDRSLSIDGTTYSYSGSTDGTGFGLMYELTYDIFLNRDNSYVLQPLVNLSWVKTDMKAYTESSAVYNDMHVHVGKHERATGSVAAGLRLLVPAGDTILGLPVTVELRANVAQDFGDDCTKLNIAMENAPAANVTVYGSKVGRTAAQFGAGITIPTGYYSSLFINGDADVRARAYSFNATIGLRYDF